MLCSLEVSSSPSFYQKNSVFSTDVLLVSSLWSHPAIFQVNGKAFIALEKKKSSFEFFTSINYLFYHWILFFFNCTVLEQEKSS